MNPSNPSLQPNYIYMCLNPQNNKLPEGKSQLTHEERMKKASGGIKKLKVKPFPKKTTTELKKDVHKGKGN